MANPRVHEVAKELGLTSKEVLAHLDKIGEGVKSHASTITEDVAARLKTELSGNGAKAPAKKTTAKKTTAKTPAKAPAAKVAPAAAPAEAKPVAPAAAPAASAPPEAEPAPASTVVKVHRGITVKDFAEKIDRSPAEIVKTLIGLGEMVTVTQSMTDDAVGLVSEELGVDVEVVDPEQQEAEESFLAEIEEDEGKLVSRPPVVTVMGHVDHGKTAILDAIRKTEVAAGEAGGITQHIGAYQIHHDGREVTFIDTPGHAAFTAMRARGAQTTDVVVLVVAADDGVMPQTVEAIDHAKAADVPIIVAVNKIDKPEADPTRVRQQLSDHDLMPEEWGGETVYVDVSAKQRTNLDTLIEMILLTSDVQLDLKANPEALARGVVIEGHLDKGRGPVATVLIKRGTLYPGD
ncbi:MAG: translation initiation factor IF-2 N-terminal domain-containing protein, partial [Actinobacteria bacterium]|nr:translation initiation factor IF-2 N-terminal domain-containing protein [Actinomycetota bacterium]